MDDVFGRENFVNCISVKMSPLGGVKRRFANIKFIKNKEYLLMYKKNNIELMPLNDTIKKMDINYTIYFDGTEFISLDEKLKIIFPNINNIPIELYF